MAIGQIQDVPTFLKAIGRGCDEVAGKFEVMFIVCMLDFIRTQCVASMVDLGPVIHYWQPSHEDRHGH